MQIIDFFKIVILSLTQAFTEFLPISSTAHLKLIKGIVDLNLNDNGMLEVAIQLGTTFALILLYRKILFGNLFSIFKSKKSFKFFLNIAIASLPAMVLGFVLYKFVKTYGNSFFVIGFSLIIGGIIILLVEKKERQAITFDFNDITCKQAFFIGLCQCFALIPGVSRSGSTIIGGLLNKLDRKTAVEFSFFLSIPVILLASIFDFYKNFYLISKNDIINIFVSFILTFVFAIPIIKTFINFISKNSLKWFGYYRVVIGFILIIVGVLSYARIGSW